MELQFIKLQRTLSFKIFLARNWYLQVETDCKYSIFNRFPIKDFSFQQGKIQQMKYSNRNTPNSLSRHHPLSTKYTLNRTAQTAQAMQSIKQKFCCRIKAISFFHFYFIKNISQFCNQFINFRFFHPNSSSKSQIWFCKYT